MMGLIWVLSIVGTVIVADQKNRSTVGFFFLSLVLGPIAFVIALLVSAHPKNTPVTPYKVSTSDSVTPQNASRQLQEIKHTLRLLQERVDLIERTLDGKAAPVTSGEP